MEGLTDRSDPNTDISCDPTTEKKILRKIELLKERLMLWTRRLDELVACLDEIERILKIFIQIKYHIFSSKKLRNNTFVSTCRIECCYERDLGRATNRNEYTVQFLLIELESVGNIRLEEGCSTDPWYIRGFINCAITTILM